MDINLIHYIKPELLIVTLALYFIDIWMKRGKLIETNKIPIWIGALSIFICGSWIVATSQFHSAQDVAMGIFASVTQGVLTAGLSTYINVLKLCRQGRNKKADPDSK